MEYVVKWGVDRTQKIPVPHIANDVLPLGGGRGGRVFDFRTPQNVDVFGFRKAKFNIWPFFITEGVWEYAKIF